MVQTAQDIIREVQQKGMPIYTLAQGTAHEKAWITINSHYMTHTTLNTQRFGVPRLSF
jgi:hypothetical protein